MELSEAGVGDPSKGIDWPILGCGECIGREVMVIF